MNIVSYWLSVGRYDMAFITAGVLGSIALAIMAGASQSGSGSTNAPRIRQFAQGISEVIRDPLILQTSVAQASQFVLNGSLNTI
jgi:hypothetical protein